METNTAMSLYLKMILHNNINEVEVKLFKTNTSSLSLTFLELYCNIPTCFEPVKALHQGYWYT